MIHIYTGSGKGKTSSALGLALRATGAGMKVFIGQFIKAAGTSELGAIKNFLPMITVKNFGRGRFIKGKASLTDIKMAKDALMECERILSSGEYDIIILDEVFPALTCGLFTEDELKKLILRKSQNSELILTGRGATEAIIALADLVTEMKEVKHYYKTGLKARKGIEY
jgi:cob(I)alamin adenosyltransferase